MYPSGYVSQIGWRPCSDASSLSANQIACSYVDNSQQVVEMWDIKGSYVPVARMNLNLYLKINHLKHCRHQIEMGMTEIRERTYLIT